jgi:hypothetical protein
MKIIFYALMFLSTVALANPELIEAAKNNNLAELSKILENNPGDIDNVDQNKWTALMHAAFNGHADVVELLLEKDANPELEDNIGNTALNLAATTGYQQVVRILRDYDAKINHMNSKGISPLQVAITQHKGAKDNIQKMKYKRIISLLLKDGAIYNDALLAQLKEQLGAPELTNIIKYKVMLRTNIDEGAFGKLPPVIVDLIMKLMGKEGYEKEATEIAAPKENIVTKALKFILPK